MKRKYYGSIHEKLDRILELLEEGSEYDTNKFSLGCPEPTPWMEDTEPEGRNTKEVKVRLETHDWNNI